MRKSVLVNCSLLVHAQRPPEALLWISGYIAHYLIEVQWHRVVGIGLACKNKTLLNSALTWRGLPFGLSCLMLWYLVC